MTDHFYGTGRRKTSTARVYLRPGSGTITVNATFSGFCASERNCKRVYSLDLVKK